MDLTSHVNVSGCVFQLLKALYLVASALYQATSGSRHLHQETGEGKESSGRAEPSAGTGLGGRASVSQMQHAAHRLALSKLEKVKQSQ